MQTFIAFHVRNLPEHCLKNVRFKVSHRNTILNLEYHRTERLHFDHFFTANVKFNALLNYVCLKPTYKKSEKLQYI